MNHSDVMDRFAKRSGTGHAGNVFSEGNAIYSYGYHFPMALALDNQKLFLINGDRYSNTTSGHQSGVRVAITRNEEWSSVILPFSALRAAGILGRASHWGSTGNSLPEDFKLLEVLPERNEWKCDQDGIGWTTSDEYTRDSEQWKHQSHDGYGTRHLLGGSLFRANGKHYLSGIDETAVSRWGAGFFLSELAGKPRTYAAAIESLKPAKVKRALAAGLEVKRQGDIFAIPTTKRTRKLPGPSEHMTRRLLGQNHTATEVRINGATFARGALYHRPNFREPEHRRITLGDQWHEIVRNTAVASFAAQGNVD